MADEQEGFAPESGPELELGIPAAEPCDDLPWPPWLENLSDPERVRVIVRAVACCYAAHPGREDGEDCPDRDQHCTATMAEHFLLKLIAGEAGPACEHDRCPRCDSPDPKMHPAMQADGGEVQLCPHPWHSLAPPLPVAEPPRPTPGPSAAGSADGTGAGAGTDMYRSAYFRVQEILDEALGTEDEDGAGQGIAADVALLAARCKAAESEVMRLKGVTVLPGMPGAEL